MPFRAAGQITFPLVLAALGAAAITASAVAQQVPPSGATAPNRVERVPAPAEQRADQVRVQANINFFVPGPTDNGDEAAALRERARRAVYQMAGRECALLRETIADDCKLESVNVNVNRQVGQPRQEGFGVSGAMTMRITLK